MSEKEKKTRKGLPFKLPDIPSTIMVVAILVLVFFSERFMRLAGIISKSVEARLSTNKDTRQMTSGKILDWKGPINSYAADSLKTEQANRNSENRRYIAFTEVSNGRKK